MAKDEAVNTARTYTLTALTDIWTGSVRLEEKDGQLRERIVPDLLITTGLLGSIRWWFEVVVRGLGGSACDPTSDGNRCPDSRKGLHEPGHHCVVCELFGCTGWARKFRFDVLDERGRPKGAQIRKDEKFKLQFTALRPVRDEEWALLDVTLRLIADYGAIGGKTVYKPTEESERQLEQHHQDFGLVKLVQNAAGRQFTKDGLCRYVTGQGWRSLNDGDFAWASIDNFWYVGQRHLSRQGQEASDFNRVLGRKEDKSEKERKEKRIVRWSDLLQDKNDQTTVWLAGRQQESKKVFSFKEPESARRTFGFVQSTENLAEMQKRLKDKAWSDLRDDEFLNGEMILAKLLKEGGTG